MSKTEAHKAIVLIHGKEKRLHRLRLLAVALHTLEREGKQFVRVHFDNQWLEVTRTDGGDLVIERRGKLVATSTMEEAEKAILEECLS